MSTDGVHSCAGHYTQNLYQLMSYIRRSRLFLSVMLLSGGLSPVQAAPFLVQAWTYATVGLTTAQAPTVITRHRPAPAAAALTDGMQASSDSRTTVLPELASEADPLSAQLSTPLGLLSASMRQWMAQALTPGQVARTLSSFGSTGAGGVAGNMAQSLIDQGWDRLEEELRGNFFRTINLSWRPGYGGREDILQIDTVMSLWDQGNSSIFGQAGLQSRDGEGGLHVGLGYRVRPVEAVLLGLNIFYDYLSDPEVSRYSLGAEAQTAYGGVSGNWYQGLSDERLSDGRTAYSPDGFDIEFSGRVPGLPYLELTGRYYRWNGQGAGTRDLEGTEYGLRLTPVPLFTVQGVYEDLSGGGDDVGMEASIEYRFGVPWQEQLRSSAVARRSDPWNRRFERVRRQYEQRVQHRGAATGGSGALRSELIVSALEPITPGDAQGPLQGVRLTFPALPAAVSEIGISWALTATPGTPLGSTVDVQRSELSAHPTVDGQYSFNLLTQATGFPFVGATSYRFTAVLKSASGSVIATLTDTGPGLSGSGLFVSASAGSDTLFLSWQRRGAQSARLSWRQASTLDVSDASGTPVAAPRVENEETTLDLTDATICPPSGTTCTYTIRGLQPGTQYTVTLQIYRGANAGSPRLNNGSVTLMTSGARAVSVVSVVATPGTISEGGPASTITLSASPAPNVRGGLSVPFTLVAGTGLSPSEYTLTDAAGNAAASPVVIPAGEASVVLTLTALTDTMAESAETLTLRLSDPLPDAGYTLASEREAAVTITDASMPAVSFTTAAVSVAETDGSVTLTLQLSGAAPSELSVPVTATAGTATAGADYTALAADAMVTFATGTTTQTVSVPIIDDDVPEGEETFTVAFGTLPSGVPSGTPDSVTVTITDDDAPSVSFTTGTVSAGEGDGTVEVSVQLNASPSSELTIPVTTVNNTALAPGDYTALSTNVTFASGASGAALMQTVSVAIIDDAIAENDETFTVAFGALPTGVSSGTPDSVTVTITDDDAPAVSFTSDAVSVAEDVSGGMAQVTLQLSGSPASTVTIPVMTANGTATAGSDYTALSAETMTFTAGATGDDLMQTVSVAILNDNRQEDDETFTVSLGILPPGVVSGTPAGVTVMITDDDMPIVSFASSTTQVAEAAGSLVVTVQLNVTPQNQIVVPVMTGGGTATAGSDYTALSGAGAMVTFAAGASGAALSRTVSVAITDDVISEGNETFTLSFGTLPTGVTAAAPNSVTVTVVDDDVPTVSFIGADAVSVAEAAGTVSLMVELSTTSSSDIRVMLETSDGTAMAGSDYTALSGGSAMVTFAANTTGAALRQTVSVAISNDDVDENDETFTVSLGTLPDGVSGGGTVTVTITDDDTPTASFTGAATRSVAEAAGTVELTVELDSTPIADIRIPVMTNNGSATVGQDYSRVSRDLVFAAAASGAALRQTVSVPVLNDTADENDETFTIGFGTLPSSVAAGTVPSVTVTITDDDVPALSVAAAPTTITEGGTSTITITATTAPANDLTVPYTITGSGITTADYTLTAGGTPLTGSTGNVTLPASQRSVALTLTAVNDADADPETLTWTLAAGTGYTVGGTNTATITIDPATVPTVQFSAATLGVTEGTDSTATVTVALSETATEQIVVPIMTMDGTANAGSDYTALTENVTFAIGEMSKDISIAITDDSVVEPDETFTVSLGTLPDSVTAGGTTSVTVTINSEDTTAVSFQTSRATILEGSEVSVSVILTNPVQSEIEFPLVFIDGSAMDGVHYTAVASVIVPAGTLSGSSRVSTVDDAVDNPNRVFTVRLGTPLPLDVTVSRGEFRVLIRDNELPVLSVAADPTTITEGETSTLTITATIAPANDLTIPYTIAGSGIVPGDYTLMAGGTSLTGLTGNVTLPAAQTSVELTLTAVDDADSSAEMLTWTLAAAPGYTVATGTATITIDPATVPTVQFSADTATVAEGVSGGMLVLTLQLSEAATEAIFVTVNTTGRTARLPGDYMMAVETAAFAVGDTMATVSIPIVNDNLIEADETFRVSIDTLRPSAGVTLGTRTVVTVTIESEDMSSVGFASADLTVGEETGSVSVEILLSGGVMVGLDTVIPLVITDGSAMDGTHYTAVTSGTIRAGDGSVNVTIPITDDDVDNADRMFTVSLGAPLPADITPGTITETTIEITDNDVPVLSVAADPTTITEGATSTITITATIAPANDLTIPYMIAGSGIAPGDYTLMASGATLTGLTGNVTLPAAQTSVELTLTAVDDADSSAEMLTWTLAAGTGYTVGATSAATVTINPAAAVPTVSFTAATATVAEDVVGGTVSVTVQLSEAPSSDVTIPIMTGGGTATADSDYTALTAQSVTFMSGTATLMQTVPITITDDMLYENDETFIVSFGTLSGVTSGATDSVEVTIVDVDTLTVSFTASSSTFQESDGTAEVTAQLSASPAVAVVIPYAVTDITAVRDSDYTAAAMGMVTFPANADSAALMQTISVDLIDDGVALEPTESFLVRIDGTSLGSRISSMPSDAAEHEVFIEDSDVVSVGISASPAAINEGETSTITLTKDKVTANPFAIGISISGGDNTKFMLADASDDEVTGTSFSVTFTAAVEPRIYTLTALDDADLTAEMLTFTINPVATDRITLGTSTATVTINDDEVPVVSFTTATRTLSENAGTVEVTVQLSAALATEVTVPYVVEDVTAVRGSDYTAVAMGMVTFPANADSDALTQTISVELIDDDVALEPTESFIVRIDEVSLGSEVSLASPGVPPESIAHEIFIEDDDVVSVEISASPAAINEGETSTITLTKDKVTANAFAIGISVSGGDNTKYALADASDEDVTGTNVTVTFTEAVEPQIYTLYADGIGRCGFNGGNADLYDKTASDYTAVG